MDELRVAAVWAIILGVLWTSCASSQDIVSVQDVGSIVIPVDEIESSQGVNVTLGQVELSRSGMHVAYSMVGVPFRSASPVELLALYPDGTIVPPAGIGVPTSDGSRMAFFPPPPDGAGYVTFKVTPVVIDAGAPAAFNISLPREVVTKESLTANHPTTIQLGETVDINGSPFTVDSVTYGQGRLEFAITSSARSGAETIFSGLDGTRVQMVVGERAVQVSGLQIGFTKDDKGDIHAGTELLKFAATDLTGYSNFEIQSPSVGLLTSGPWEFRVSLP